MGLDSLWHWAILLAIVVVVFGTGKMAKIGPDLGHAIRGFKNAMQGNEPSSRVDIEQHGQLASDHAALQGVENAPAGHSAGCETSRRSGDV